MIISAAAAIEINKQALNELNVFPVPDGDTGTNMSMTINAAAADLRKTWRTPTLEKAAKRGRLRHAAGRPGQLRRHSVAAVPGHFQGPEGQARKCDGGSVWPALAARAWTPPTRLS